MRDSMARWIGSSGVCVAELLLVACGGGGGGGTTAPSTRRVRFEVVGSHSGTINVITTTSLGNTATRPAAVLPWVFDTIYGAEIRGVGMGGQTELARRGREGRTANARIYVDGVLVSQSGVQSASLSGIIGLPTQSYVFP
jgi:hypothetical protein